MMNPTRSAFFAAFALALVLAAQGCCGNCGIEKTPIPEDKQAFIGNWTGENGTDLSINGDGSGSVKITKGVSKEITGGAVTFEGKDKLKIGLFGLEHIFNIDEAPEGDAMKLSGESFEKK